MISKELDNITLEDIQNLIDNFVQEGKTLEYKECISLNSDLEKKEFLFDVSSFANTNGGDIIFGIKQNKETGYPEEIVGTEILNIDKLQLQIDSMLRESISPRLPSVKYLSILFKENLFVFIIRIANSWNKPHQVTFRRTDKFYSRGTNGKYPMDVFELKNAFISADSLSQNINKFRIERLTKILSDEGVIPLLGNGKIILQIIPLISFQTGILNDLKVLYSKSNLLEPIGESSYLIRYNFDGILSYSSHKDNNSYASYLQFHKNGIVESVNSWIIQPFDGSKRLFIESIEESILRFIEKVKMIYKVVNIEPPFVALLTLTGVLEYKIGSHNIYLSFNDKQVEKDNLIFPDILIEDWNNEIDLIAKPWFDSLWNAVGYAESKSYVDGRWRRPLR